MRAYERFLNYVKIDTTSSEQSQTSPTTSKQFDLANHLAQEMKEMGIQQVRVTEYCYVYGVIPATDGYENQPAVGLIAHMDTTPEASGSHVNPQIISDYDGNDIVLKNQLVISKKHFPHLERLKGRTLITTDGTTLLGSDDKAGIAEILTACEQILTQQIPHGKICIAFTPDEEVGQGTNHFDVEGFGADFAYTVDGGEEGELEFENFNGADADFEITGYAIHPGSAKNRMINASLVAMEINAMLPSGDVPAKTEGYQGFYHLVSMKGNTEQASLHYIIRDHDKYLFKARKDTMRHIEQLINEKYGEHTVVLTINDRYYNMNEVLKDKMFLVDYAKTAMEHVGVKPIVVAIRGGTDGARLSFMGLPCPNLGTGGFAGHGPYEHITVEGMDITVKIIIELLKIYTEFKV